MRTSRRMIVRAFAFGAALTFASAGFAQSWPQRNVTMIVSQAAGASPDVLGRLIADRMAKSLGVGVVVENRPGAANVTGSLAAARAEPDGHTIFFATGAALVSNAFLIKSLPYDPMKSFVPIAFVSRSDQLVLVHPDLKATTLPELVALEKKEPGKISMGVDSPRNLAGITAQAINRRGGINLALVPYPNITGALQDLLTGRIQTAILSTSITAAHIREGKLRPVATASAQRAKLFPSVPAIAETFPGLDFSGWFMMVAPAGTPAAVIARLNAEIAAAVKDQKVLETVDKLGFEIGVGSPEAAATFLKAQFALWAQITKELGLDAL